jgi:hypothetical protein
MMSEHDTAGDLLARMRLDGLAYAVPADACASYRALYAALEELEVDLHHTSCSKTVCSSPEPWRWKRARGEGGRGQEITFCPH